MCQKSNEKNIERKFLLLLYFGVIVSVIWVMKKNNTFIFDDYSNIFMAKSQSYAELFHFFPSQRYNDRCIAVMFVKLLYDLFGLNIQMYHIAFSIIHLINVFLVYKITYVLIDNKETEIRIVCATIGAAIFGIYPISLMSVAWVSAEYEMVCSIFYLLCIYSYLKVRKKGKNIGFYSYCCVLSYFLALRSKEMAIVLPVIFLLYEIGNFVQNKKIKISPLLIVLICTMIIFAVILFSKSDVSGLAPDDSYYQNYSIFSMIKSAMCYLLLYFDLNNSGFTYSGASISSYVGLGIVAIILCYAIYLMLKKRKISVLLGIITIGISLAPVLPLINLQHRLYLYIPSIFIAFTVALCIEQMICPNWNIRLIAVISVILLILVNYAPGVVQFKNVWIQYCETDMNEIKQLLQKEPLVEGANVYVKGASNGYNIFFYGPGNSVKLFLSNDTINVLLVDEFPEQLETPFVLWEYSDGKISEIDRDNSPKPVNIEEIYPEKIILDESDAEINIAVVCENINENLEININDDTVSTIVGKDFLSTTVYKSDIENDSYLLIKVIDKESGAASESLKIYID